MAHPNDLAAEVVEATDHARAVGSLDSARRDKERARRVEALSLRLAGIPVEAIAERLEISETGVKDLINRTLERATNHAVTELRDIEGARLDRAQSAIWKRVLDGDIKAIDTYLRISQQRARLFGLNAPQVVKLDLSIRQEMEQALAELETVVLQGEVVTDAAVVAGPDPEES